MRRGLSVGISNFLPDCAAQKKSHFLLFSEILKIHLAEIPSPSP